jgi:hypothetical protein
MATPVIFFNKTIGYYFFFVVIYLATIFFQGPEFGYCVFFIE